MPSRSARLGVWLIILFVQIYVVFYVIVVVFIGESPKEMSFCPFFTCTRQQARALVQSSRRLEKIIVCSHYSSILKLARIITITLHNTSHASSWLKRIHWSYKRIWFSQIFYVLTATISGSHLVGRASVLVLFAAVHTSLDCSSAIVHNLNFIFSKTSKSLGPPERRTDCCTSPGSSGIGQPPTPPAWPPMQCEQVEEMLRATCCRSWCSRPRTGNPVHRLFQGRSTLVRRAPGQGR